MAANSTHPDYDASAVDWSRVRDVMAGEDAVKAAGAKYLPRLEAQSDEEYAAYRSRACFFNATRRAADAFVGLVFRKAPFVKIPEVQGPRSKVQGPRSKVQSPKSRPHLTQPSPSEPDGPKQKAEIADSRWQVAGCETLKPES